MKAVRIHAHGDIDQLHIDEVEKPSCGEEQVLVHVKYASLNHLDLWVRRGMKGLRIPLPMVMGSDCSGIIEAVGVRVSHLKPGDRVIVQPAVSCGHCEYCLKGMENYCRDYHIRGELVTGVQQEFIVVDSRDVIKLSDTVDLAEAASIVLVFQTVYEMLMRKAALKPGETVLVMGASSGIGTAALQLARLMHARTIAVTTSEWKLEKLKQELRPDYVLLYSNDLYKQVKKITAGRGVDLVVEHVGEATWNQSVRSLRIGGRVVTCGATTGPEVNIDLRHLFIKQQRILGSTMGRKGDMFEIVRFLERGLIRGIIHQILPFQEVKEAHRILENKEQFGKILLQFH